MSYNPDALSIDSKHYILLNFGKCFYNDWKDMFQIRKNIEEKLDDIIYEYTKEMKSIISPDEFEEFNLNPHYKEEWGLEKFNKLLSIRDRYIKDYEHCLSRMIYMADKHFMMDNIIRRSLGVGDEFHHSLIEQIFQYLDVMGDGHLYINNPPNDCIGKTVNSYNRIDPMDK